MRRAEQDPIDRNQLPMWPSGVDTSEAAAFAVYPVTGAQRRAIYNLICATPSGLTCDAIEEQLGMLHQSCGARVKELADMGAIEDSGKRRPTRSGCAARVYVKAEPKPEGE